MTTHQAKTLHRIRRHRKIRMRISGTAQRPRVSVFKSNRHMFVQVIDDVARKTLLSSQVVSQKKSTVKGKKTEVALKIGEMLAEKMKAQGIKEALFDRGGYQYHGRVKAVADGLRAGGITI